MFSSQIFIARVSWEMIKTGEEQISRNKASLLCLCLKLASVSLNIMYEYGMWELLFYLVLFCYWFLLLFWNKMSKEITKTLSSFKSSLYAKLQSLSWQIGYDLMNYHLVSFSQLSYPFASTNWKAAHCLPSCKVIHRKLKQNNYSEVFCILFTYNYGKVTFLGEQKASFDWLLIF